MNPYGNYDIIEKFKMNLEAELLEPDVETENRKRVKINPPQAQENNVIPIPTRMQEEVPSSLLPIPHQINV